MQFVFGYIAGLLTAFVWWWLEQPKAEEQSDDEYQVEMDEYYNIEEDYTEEDERR